MQSPRSLGRQIFEKKLRSERFNQIADLDLKMLESATQAPAHESILDDVRAGIQLFVQGLIFSIWDVSTCFMIVSLNSALFTVSRC